VPNYKYLRLSCLKNRKPKPKTKAKTALQKLVTPSEAGQFSASSRSQKEREDDAYIAYLENKLGYGKGGKSKKQAEEDDGLDDLLDFTSSIVPSLQPESASEASEISEESDGDISDEASISDEVSTHSDVEDTAEDEAVVTTLSPAPAKPAAKSASIPGTYSFLCIQC
jgi:nucleolar MIF4G domain-containing protein 1